MKKRIVYFFILLLAIIMQTSVLPIISKLQSPGDIVLMLVLVGAVLDGFFGFFWFAIFAGIFYDLASYTQLGVHALIFLLVIYFVSFFSRRFSVEIKGVGILLFAAFVFIASIVSRVIIALSMARDLQDLHQFPALFGSLDIVFFQSIFNVFLFFLCFYVIKKIRIFFDII
ncbi:MAG: hypothetical protein ACD_9C00333G0002 [uncultured bacterium]|nr:MAG: hypothetical protein ACD_9C00333G0002 [uncultured bacterium]